MMSLMRLVTPLRRDAVRRVVGDLLAAPALGLADGAPHRIGDRVGVQDRAAVDVARGAADGLDQRALRAQEAFLVGVEDRHQRHLGQVEPFAQQVDADQHVELAQAQVADDLDALDGLDVGVQVAHLDAVLAEVVGQVLGHALGERGHQHALVLRRRASLISDSRSSTWVAAGRTSTAGSTRPVGRTTCSTTCAWCVALVVGRRRRDEDRLPHQPLELVEAQRPVVQRRGQAEAVVRPGSPCASGRPCTCRRAAGW